MLENFQDNELLFGGINAHFSTLKIDKIKLNPTQQIQRLLVKARKNRLLLLLEWKIENVVNFKLFTENCAYDIYRNFFNARRLPLCHQSVMK